MARCLNAYHWAVEPLNEDAYYKSDDIIVADSDIDDSRGTKLERKRRREALGRRYLLGHVPFIQTSSLRGPFGRNSGWVAPWGRIKPYRKDPKQSTGARNYSDNTKTRGEINPEYETLVAEDSVEAPIEEDFLDKHILDDAVRYDADNEDDAFEEMDDEDRNPFHCAGNSDETQAEHTHLRRGESHLQDNSDNNISDASAKDFQQLVKHKGSRGLGRAGKGASEGNRKRKMDTSWLRGANFLKRSRHEALEDSSPTPMAGAMHEGKKAIQSGPLRQTSNIETSDGREHSQMLPTSNISKLAMQPEPTKETCMLSAFLERDDGSPWDVTEERTWSLLLSNGQSVATDRADSVHSSLAQQDMNGLPETSQRQHTSLHFLGKQQAELAQFSSSGLDVKDIRSLSSARLLTNQEENSTSYNDDNQVSNKLARGLSPRAESVMDEEKILSHLESKVDFRDTPSPASVESFHYRKTSRKPQGRKSRPSVRRREEETIVMENDASTPERDSRALPPKDAHVRHSSNYASSGSATGVGVQTDSTTSRTKTNGRHKNWSMPFRRNLDSLNVLGVVSSPDPLSEDFKDGHQQQTTPATDEILGQIPAKPSQEDVAAVECQRTEVAHVSSALQQQAALRGQSRLSTANASVNLMEISTGSTHPTECWLSDYEAPQSVLLAKGDDMDETTPVQGRHLNRKLSPHSKSPTVNSTHAFSPHNLQQPDALAIPPIGLKHNMEPSQPSDPGPQVASSSISTPARFDAEVLRELAGPTQSTWTALSLEPLQPDSSWETGSNGSKYKPGSSVTRLHLGDVPFGEADSTASSSKVDDMTIVDGDADRDEGNIFEPFQSLFNHPGQISDELSRSPPRFLSTQTLFDATTANPGNSAFKKARRNKSDKRVSFGPLPSGEFGGPASGASSKSLERMGSPPPPAGTLRLTQLDDPFHYRLKATRNLEVTEESLTKFMNTPWDDLPMIKPRPKPPSSSPAVVAMAEAFIAADQSSFHEKFDIGERSLSTKIKPAEIPLQPRVQVTHERPELRSSSPLDASFSIAPNGMVTTVSIGAPGYDAEDNLHAVIEDMGSFLAGWDVESELKKAKGHKFEKGNDTKAQRKREYLAGISNR